MSSSFLAAAVERSASSAAPSAPTARSRVIFLDIDGVLNRTKTATHIRLEPDLVGRLKQITQATNCDIVLSTFWRTFEQYVRYILHRHGIPGANVIGRTPGGASARDSPGKAVDLGTDPADDAQYTNRAAEIRAWLSAHPEVEQFVILDDRGSAADAGLAQHFVQTVSTVGLTDADVVRARTILMGGE